MTAQLSVAIKYGSNDDSKEKIGNAHFLEHMLVGGSQNRIKLHHEIERLGGSSHFETSTECTFSKVDVLPENIVKASDILSDLLFDPTFEEEKLEIERKVILNEIAVASDDPQNKIGEALIKNLFKYHPIRYPISGTKKTVKQLTLSDIEKTYRNYYAPQNMILILTGNFSDKAEEVIIEDFEKRQKTNITSRNFRKPEVSKPKKETLLRRAGLTQAYLSFGLRTVPAKNPDVPPLDLIDSILGTGESSRLFIELREKRALTYDFETMNVPGLDYGYFTIDCAVKTKALKQTQKLIQSELEKIKTNHIPKIEIEKSKKMLIANIFRTIDDPHELPRFLADSEIHYENEKALENYIKNITQLTGKDIQETANKYFQEENYAKVTLTPKK